MKTINTSSAPAAMGPYSQGIVSNSTMQRSHWFAFPCIIALAMVGTLCAQNNEEPNFWFLEPGTEATAENRINTIQNVGRGLLDFAIYQPTGSTFPEEYRQNLIDAGFVFDFLTEEQLAETNHTNYLYLSPVGRMSILVVPKTVSMPVEEITRLRFLFFAFLGKAPDLPESESQRGFSFISLAEKKNEIATEQQRMRDRLVANPTFADRTDEEIEEIIGKMPTLTPPPTLNQRHLIGLDQIGNDLAEAIGPFSERARIFPEGFVAETGAKMLARRELVWKVEENSTTDVFYVFANTKDNAKPIDGWFQLRERKGGRLLGRVHYTDGREVGIMAQPDRAFIMDPATGKIGAVALHHIRAVDRNDWYMRIQMKPGETLIVRVVRERARSGSGPPAGTGFQEFESLPAWEYEGEVPEVPLR